MKNIQISYDLFCKLLQYHLMDMDEFGEEIRKELDEKLNAMVMHDLYTKSKTAPTDSEREEARQKYLDRRGVQEDFRWDPLSKEGHRNVARPCR